MVDNKTPRLHVAGRGEKAIQGNPITLASCWHCGLPFPVGDGRRWCMHLCGWTEPAHLLVCPRCLLLLLNSECIRRRFAADLSALPGRPSRAGWYLVEGRGR